MEIEPRFLSACSFFSGTRACAVSWSLRMFSEQPAPTGTANDGAVTARTSEVAVFRTEIAGAAETASASAHVRCPTHPGGARLRSKPHASLTSLPATVAPSMRDASEPIPLPLDLSPGQVAAQATVAVVSRCSAESQTPLSWM